MSIAFIIAHQLNFVFQHHWLVSHNLIKSDAQKKRDDLVKLMQQYYYSVSDTVYSSWSDSQLKEWLVDNGIMKSNAQASRDKMLKLVGYVIFISCARRAHRRMSSFLGIIISWRRTHSGLLGLTTSFAPGSSRTAICVLMPSTSATN